MDSRQPELSRLTLMCSDHEVAEFTWNHDRQAVTGKTHVLDAAHAPLMATDPSGNITRDRLSSWFKNRGIPDFRPDAADRLRAVGYPSAASLMASGFGASLSALSAGLAPLTGRLPARNCKPTIRHGLAESVFRLIWIPAFGQLQLPAGSYRIENKTSYR